MQQAAQLPVENQLSPGGPLPLQPQLTPDVRDGRVEKPAPQPRPGPPGSQQPVPQRVPRLRAVEESQAFKDILVDEMDMMHVRAATLIQANWRGHRLRQELVSQMTAAKAVQEAWRRFSTRRLRRSGRLRAHAQVEEGDIPYHPPQQVRFRSQPAVVSEETQAPCAHVLAPRGPPAAQRPAARGPQAPCTPTAAVPPHQATACPVPCPGSLDSECRPGPVPTTGRGPRLVSSHVVLNAAECRYVTSRATKAGALEPPASGSCSPAVCAPRRTQAHTDAEPLRTPSQTHRVAAPTRTPAQTYPAPAVTRTQPQPCPAPNKAYAQVRPTPSPARPTPPVSRTPPQPGSVTMATKTSPQMHLVTTPVGSPLRTTQPATVCKTPPQPGPSSPKTKPPPRMRLAAIITRTPAAHIRSVAAVLKTLCLTLQAPGNPRAPPGAAQQAAGTPGTSPSLHADTPRTRGPANTPQATAGMAKVSDLRCRAEGSVRIAPQPHLESGARGAPTRGPVRTEKTHTGVQKLVNVETGSKAAAQATRAPSWARLAEERSQPLSQMHQRTEVLKVQSQVYVPIQAEVALPRAQVAVPLTKARALGQPPKVSSQAHPHKAQLAVWPPATSHGPPPTEQTKALSQPHLATCPAKASSRAPPSGGLSKAPSLMHLVTCLTRAQPQAQLVTDATRRVCAAHQTPSRGSEAPSHPLLTGLSAPTHRCRPPGALGSGSRVKPDHRQGDMGLERQGMLVPLLAAAAATHPSCNVEPWGNSKTTRAQLPTPSQAAPGQEDMVASQIADLCAELVTMLDSQEDLRVLLTKALSQGEVRAILNQALSSEILGATMAKVLPQSMLGMVLAKALSWGELGTTLSRALPRAELCTELTKAVQGRLAEVLSRALTQEERAALSRALCQGELGAVLSQFLSRAAPRTGTVLPKASSKVTSSKMPLLPAPAWGPGLGSPVWLQSHKGPVDTGTCGQPCNSPVPSVAVRPLDRFVGPHDMWQPPRGSGLWGRTGQARTPDWTVSLQHMERVIIHAATVIQACARGCLVRRTIKVWHQRATVIQATWRGHHVRRNLARLYRATVVIQAAWRGHRVRQARARHMQLPHAWAEPGCEVRAAPEHRCFQSCQPRLCSLCCTLSPGLGSPPSVVMLVGSSPRTCHTCGHMLPTRVVCGVGQAGAPRTCASWPPPRAPQELWDAAATTIQLAWKGFKVRRQLRKQLSAARMLQATWRGHYTRSCLTPEALLGTGSPWDSAPGAPRLGTRLSLHWPGI